MPWLLHGINIKHLFKIKKKEPNKQSKRREKKRSKEESKKGTNT